MLCTKIIFTNVEDELFFELADYIKSNTDDFDINAEDGIFLMEFNCTDKVLYEFCCIMFDKIFKPLARDSIRRSISQLYGCFNPDEIEMICQNTLKRDYTNEVPGRMYVYLKLNEEINPIGFYTFMCTDIKKYLLSVLQEEAERILELNDKLDMIETLKCFSEMSLENTQKVVLKATGYGLEIIECVPENLNFSSEYSLEESDVLAELVTLNPKIIEIYGKDEFAKNEMSSVIEAVFEDRIYYK